MHCLQVGFGELPFNRVDHFPTCPDICFRVEGYDFLCHKVFLTASHGQHDDRELFYLKRMPACSSRRFSVDAATTLRLWWRITSVRESSCSRSPAPRPLLCTTFRMTSSSASCITSTLMTLRFVFSDLRVSDCFLYRMEAFNRFR